MYAFFQLFNTIVDLYVYCLIAVAVLSWLMAFGVINTYNPIVNRVSTFLEAITEPALRQIRRVVPVIGGLDLSILVLFIGIQFARQLVNELFFFQSGMM